MTTHITIGSASFQLFGALVMAFFAVPIALIILGPIFLFVVNLIRPPAGESRWKMVRGLAVFILCEVALAVVWFCPMVQRNFLSFSQVSIGPDRSWRLENALGMRIALVPEGQLLGAPDIVSSTMTYYGVVTDSATQWHVRIATLDHHEYLSVGDDKAVIERAASRLAQIAREDTHYDILHAIPPAPPPKMGWARRVVWGVIALLGIGALVLWERRRWLKRRCTKILEAEPRDGRRWIRGTLAAPLEVRVRVQKEARPNASWWPRYGNGSAFGLGEIVWTPGTAPLVVDGNALPLHLDGARFPAPCRFDKVRDKDRTGAEALRAMGFSAVSPDEDQNPQQWFTRTLPVGTALEVCGLVGAEIRAGHVPLLVVDPALAPRSDWAAVWGDALYEQQFLCSLFMTLSVVAASIAFVFTLYL